MFLDPLQRQNPIQQQLTQIRRIPLHCSSQHSAAAAARPRDSRQLPLVRIPYPGQPGHPWPRITALPWGRAASKARFSGGGEGLAVLLIKTSPPPPSPTHAALSSPSKTKARSSARRWG